MLSVACERGEARTGGEADERPAARCPTEKLPCRVRLPQCQKALFELTSCLREQPEATMPPVRVITREELEEQLRAELDEGEPPSLEARALDSVLPLLLLARPGAAVEEVRIEQLVEGVAAFYDEEQKSISVLEDVIEEEGEGASVYLAHEFVHALQDQREGLEDLEKSDKSFDQKLATLMLDEGEAVLFEQLALLAMEDEPPAANNLVEPWSDLLSLVLDDIEASDAPLTLTYDSLSYAVGGVRLGEAYLAGGTGAVAAYHAQPLDNVLGWIDESAQAPRPLACGQPDAPSGLATVGSDRLGFGGLLAFGSALGLSGEEAYDFARSWRNDELTLYARDDLSAVAFAFRIALGSEADALMLRELAANLSNVTVTRAGSELRLLGATHEEILDTWAASDSCLQSKEVVPGDRGQLTSLRTRPLVHTLRRHSSHR